MNPALQMMRKDEPSATATTQGKGKGKDKEAPAAGDGNEDDSEHEGMAIPPDDLSTDKFAAFTRTGKGAAADVGPSGNPYTPLEKQVMHFKEKYSGILLIFEVGYKYRFYGEDARVAAQALGHVCYRNRNFLSASFPVTSRSQHVKKLLSLGHKVGIIGQAETAALKKVGNNRNKLFERKLLHLWTSATYIDDLDSHDNTDEMHQGSPPSIMCLVEERQNTTGENVRIGLVSVTSSTGDVVYDEFEDTRVRTELETRIAYLKPWELLLPSKGLTKLTDEMLKLVDTYSMRGQTRTERFKSNMDYSAAFDALSKASKAGGDDDAASGRKFSITKASCQLTQSRAVVAAILDLPRQVVVAIAQVFKYLEQYKLSHVLLHAKAFRRFSEKTHMLLNASTLTNLEVFQNQTTLTKKGSLWGLLDRTETTFGSRLLKDWIGRPLVDRARLQERLDAVEEIRTPSENGHLIDQLRELLKRFSSKAFEYPDLAKGLSKIQNGKCTPQELGRILSAFRKIANTFKGFDAEFGPGMRSRLLNDILATLPSIRDIVERLTENFSFDAAAKGQKEHLWRNEDMYPAVDSRIFAITATESDLQDELKEIRKIVHMPALKYKEVTSALADEYVVEIEKSANIAVPEDWDLVSRTKKYSRYRSAGAAKLLFILEQHREMLDQESEEALQDFQRKISEHYVALRHAVTQLATADCLVSLAHVSMEPSYCQPTFVDTNVLDIKGGRHPMIELLRDDPYTPNSILLGGRDANSKVITGPNMGGKSSFVRMVALIVIMAQVGSYVPAESATLGMHDALLARMGASDELMKGRSTFMVEMSETNEIIRSATPRSLVILDELGRGTSTFDGMAIASAVLEHFVTETSCKVLFITHYPHVATSLQEKYPFDVSVAHMGFVESEGLDGVRTIHFLYQLKPGLAGSFGIECGRLAGLPEPLLESAAIRSAILQEQVQRRVDANK
ncbi:hypothetical protein AURDEDRAFT_87246 [Auricularia subglabra TFB-10046 SS5]|nr:hypothetical protein AURDEDRAFT_87246 [Auricularia subglabra TFB-10046 SS5]